MLDKLVKHLKRNRGAYSWAAGIGGGVLLNILLFVTLIEFRLLMVVIWSNILLMPCAVRFLARFLQCLSTLRFCPLAKELGSSDSRKRIDWNGLDARRLAARGLGTLKAKEGIDALVNVFERSRQSFAQRSHLGFGQNWRPTSNSYLAATFGRTLNNLRICEKRFARIRC